MEHPGHQHSLILNEIYIAKEGDVCSGCREQIDSCKSFVYSCSTISSTTSDPSGAENRCVEFLLHKTCAELPPTIVNPADQEEFLVFYSVPKICRFYKPSAYSRHMCCILCFLPWKWFSYCSTSDMFLYVCIKCVVFRVQQSKQDPKFDHPGHTHPLALIEHPSSFKCYACQVNDPILDMSYRCTKCQFWMHKSCGDAPASFQFQFHKHPLILSFSLPRDYLSFPQHCRVCNETLNITSWIYYCRNCRYFTHFQCARSSPVLRSTENETYPDVMHLPTDDESSLNLLLEQFAQDKTTTLYNSYNNSSIFSTTNHIRHWAHEEHDLELITISDAQKHNDEILLLCEGCLKPIRTDEGLFYYGCVPCKYFMHKICAELPREIKHHHRSPYKTLYANKYSEPFKLFRCKGCGVDRNGNAIFYSNSERLSDEPPRIYLDIGCVTLPEIIKHETHHHQLDKVYEEYHHCNACGFDYLICKYRCEKCNFYICAGCITMVRRLKHAWDPHPLDLIYDAGMVSDHEHDFDCEYCSKEINTNRWFYHCSDCDLSFHPNCLKKSSYRNYPYVKFGAADIILDKLHPHTLTLVYNKRARWCDRCGEKQEAQPVLRCAPCNAIFCRWCCSLAQT